jgi:hypothetical protein
MVILQGELKQGKGQKKVSMTLGQAVSTTYRANMELASGAANTAEVVLKHS